MSLFFSILIEIYGTRHPEAPRVRLCQLGLAPQSAADPALISSLLAGSTSGGMEVGAFWIPGFRVFLILLVAFLPPCLPANDRRAVRFPPLSPL